MTKNVTPKQGQNGNDAGDDWEEESDTDPEFELPLADQLDLIVALLARDIVENAAVEDEHLAWRKRN